MNLKEFFKPTIAKIIISITVLFIPFIRQTICGIFEGSCKTIYHSLFSLSLQGLKSASSNYVWVGIFILLASMIISFLISCVIIYLINLKLKKELKIF